MMDTDLQIIDADPKESFDFYLSQLNEQRIARQSPMLLAARVDHAPGIGPSSWLTVVGHASTTTL